MADEEDAGTDEAPEEGEEVDEEASDEGDQVSEETDEEEAEAAGEEAEAAEAEADEAEGDPGETSEEDEAPEEAKDKEAEADEAADGGEEDAGEEAADGEEDEDLEEIETAMAGEGEEDEEEPPSQPTVSTDGRFYGTGRRKEAVARVWIEAGSGEVTVNGNDLSAYFSSRAKWTEAVRGPLECLGMEDSVDVWATAEGGGLTGQADAIELGLARALVEMDENARHWLRPEGHLTRDDREVERKKINQPGARAKSQVSKR